MENAPHGSVAITPTGVAVIWYPIPAAAIVGAASVYFAVPVAGTWAKGKAAGATVGVAVVLP